MTALDEARRAVEVLEQYEQATDEEARLTLSVRARGWLCLAATSLQPPAAEQATIPMRAVNTLRDRLRRVGGNPQDH